jgi:hypothetical protein
LFTGVRNVHVTPGTRIAGLPRNTFKLAVDWKPSPHLTLGADVNAVSSLPVQGNEDGQADSTAAWRATSCLDCAPAISRRRNGNGMRA